MNDYMEFEGYDELELYVNDEGQMEFCQEFGGINVLSDDDVQRLADMCLGYLRRKEK